MKLSYIGASIFLTGVFLYLGFYPESPSVESLIVEEAMVKAIKPNGFASTVAEFSTNQDMKVTCVSSGKTSVWHCPIGKLRELMQQGVPIKIWHDNKKVYRAELNSKLILDARRTWNDRMFMGVLAFLCSLPLWLAFGRRAGLINPPMKQEVFVPAPSQSRSQHTKTLDIE